jgi:tRNA G18 (ribose-2'-O)-methylase SpoU
MAVIEVSDIDDPRLDDYRHIRDRELRGREAFGGLFIGEQRLVVERMLAMPGVTKSVLAVPDQAGAIAPLAGPEVSVYAAPFAVMKQVAGFNIHRGVLAAGYRHAVERPQLDGERLGRDRLTLLLCENIVNMDNIGFLFRNAAAFAVDGVLLGPRCHDPLYRKSLRVSIGHVLSVPFARSRDWLADLDRLRRAGVTLIAAATAPGSADLESVPCPPKVALVVGQEYEGVTSQTLAHCHRIVRIPMAPGVDSLNVAVAAAVCLHRFSTGARE